MLMYNIEVGASTKENMNILIDLIPNFLLLQWCFIMFSLQLNSPGSIESWLLILPIYISIWHNTSYLQTFQMYDTGLDCRLAFTLAWLNTSMMLLHDITLLHDTVIFRPHRVWNRLPLEHTAIHISILLLSSGTWVKAEYWTSTDTLIPRNCHSASYP